MQIDLPGRRRLLQLGAAGVVAGLAMGREGRGLVGRALGQEPRPGGTFRLRFHIPPVHFDPHQTLAFSTMIPLSFTHSRLVKVRAGAAVVPGTQPIEGDLAESWERIGSTTYVFNLRKGVGWHPRPPVNGRELTAEDVKYTYDRFLTVKGNANRPILGMIREVQAPDRYTVRFILREPNAWFVDRLASTSTWIIAKECVAKFGDLRQPESVVGTGPWMLARYEPGAKLEFVRHPSYFVPGLPHADGVEIALIRDSSAGLAAFLAGHCDFGPEYGMVLRRSDLDTARARIKGLETREFVVVFGSYTAVKLGRAPFRDLRVRRALAMAQNWREVLDANGAAMGHGAPNPLIPAALAGWSIPIAELGPEGRRLYDHDPVEARRLLAEAGYPKGVITTAETTGAYGADWMDEVQIAVKNWKGAGIEAQLALKEYGGFMSSAIFGKFDGLMLTLRGGTTDPDTYFTHVLPGEPLNAAGVNDAKLTEMVKLQRRTFAVERRRDIIHDIQRRVADNAYYSYGPSASQVAAWMPYVKNFGPNIGHDYGGRLMVAWLDR